MLGERACSSTDLTFESFALAEDYHREPLFSIDVSNRTSSSFTALISWNDSSVNVSELRILPENCSLHASTPTEQMGSNTSTSMRVECNTIEESAGRNWSFSVIREQNGSIVSISNFTVTLPPLPLDSTTKIVVTIDENLTSASIHVPQCWRIANERFLAFRCNTSDATAQQSLGGNCSWICSNLNAGLNSTGQFVRLSIPIIDKVDRQEGDFPEATLDVPIKTSSEIHSLDTWIELCPFRSQPNFSIGLSH